MNTNKTNIARGKANADDPAWVASGLRFWEAQEIRGKLSKKRIDWELSNFRRWAKELGII